MVVVGQLGARMHYAVPKILAQAGILERLYTDICAPRILRPVLEAAAGLGSLPLRRWLGRVPAGVPAGKIVSFDAMGLEYYRRRNLGTPGALTAANLWVGPAFCRRIIRRGLGAASTTFTYNGAGLELMRYARASGVRTVMEQTIAPADIEDGILAAEDEEFPDWELAREKDPFRRAFAEREHLEWEQADIILCGSEFVRETIGQAGGPAERCVVVPYGVEPHGEAACKDQRSRPLRILVVGSVGLRKGAPYVLETARRLARKAEFRVAGQFDVTPHAQQLLAGYVDLLGPVPRAEIHRQFQWADVFFLPTLCEGSATVCYEALSYGLPVITTPHAGSVVRDGIDGFIVPIRDVGAMVDRIELLADDGDLWAALSRNALVRAAEFSLDKYGERFLAALEAGQPSAIRDAPPADIERSVETVRSA